jgi:hypothetical protein
MLKIRRQKKEVCIGLVAFQEPGFCGKFFDAEA